MTLFDAAMIGQIQQHRRSPDAAAEMRSGGRLIARLAGVFGAILLIVLTLDAAVPGVQAGTVRIAAER